MIRMLALLASILASPALAAPSFTIGNSTAREESGQLCFPVRKHGRINNLPSTVTFYVIASTAKAGSDYADARHVLSFAASEMLKQGCVALVDDAAPEPSETLTGKIAAGTNARLYDGTAVGTIIDSDVAVPLPPPPQPLDPATGLPVIASNFAVASELEATTAAPSAAPDVVGAFRFICGPGQLSYDDPILYPGQPGRSHLHQFYGNTGANASSTYSSLRTSGQSTCMSPLNRSAYWMPAMLDGRGNVVRPDYVSIYYKRLPLSDPRCTRSNPNAMGDCVPLPNGVRFIFGYDPTGLNSARTGAAYFNCQGPTARPGSYLALTDVRLWCPPGNQLGAIIEAPSCWNGKDADSPDHRSHMAYRSSGVQWPRCPDTHPKVIPTWTLGAWYTVAPGDDPGLWDFSSAMMAPGKPRGYTFHADFFPAWDPVAIKLWHDFCINLMLNCSTGQLGNGQKLRQSWPFTWKANPRLVPIPQE